jgi:hypothetical protein
MATLAIASVPDVVSANDVLASTIGEDLQVRSEASAQTLNISLGDNTITATSIEVGATAGCDAESESGVALDANTTITGLIVNGEQITVTGDPDQEVPLLGGQLLLNQQTFSSNEDMLSIDVVGLSASVDSLGQVDVGIASAGMTCPTGEPCEDFITGGGWIMGTPSGSKATFAVSGGLHEDDADWGHLTYHEHDRADGVKIKGTGVSDYTVIDEVTRRIEGSANVSGEGAVTYVIEVRDMGEPGRADTFSIELSNGYSASGTLGGGNIQLHECP